MNKNLEAKKITEEKAKELIIKKLLENSKNPNEIIEKITEEILKIINCQEEISIINIRKWLYTLYMMYNNINRKFPFFIFKY